MSLSLLMCFFNLLGGGSAITPNNMELVGCSTSDNVQTKTCSYRSTKKISYRECGECPSDNENLYFMRKNVIHKPDLFTTGDCYVRCEYVRLKVKDNLPECAQSLCNPRQSGLPLTDCVDDPDLIICEYEGISPIDVRDCPEMMRDGILIADLSRIDNPNYITQRCKYRR